MRVVLLGHSLRIAGGLSVGKNIISTLPRIAPRHEYLATVPADAGYGEVLPANVRVVPVPAQGLAARIRFEHRELPAIVAGFQPDWVWGLGNVGLPHPPCRQAILFQDSHLVYPERYFGPETFPNRLKKRLLRLQLRRCLKATQLVFCQTATSQSRFVHVMRYKGTTALCPNAVSAFAVTPARLNVPPAIALTSGRFRLLVLTKYYPHKNIERIVDAYAQYPDELKDTACVLTIDASQGVRAARLLDRIARMRLTTSVVNVGSLKQEQLAEHYMACDAVLLPTLLESFSGTYLEAMHFGRPILTSDLDFAHDVCGDAAFYFDPWHPKAIKDAIVRLKSDRAMQQNLIQCGKARLQGLFRSWPEILRGVAHELGIECD